MSIEEAKHERAQARKAMQAAKLGSKLWLDAEENLNFWQGKIAALEAIDGRNDPRRSVTFAPAF